MRTIYKNAEHFLVLNGIEALLNEDRMFWSHVIILYAIKKGCWTAIAAFSFAAAPYTWLDSPISVQNLVADFFGLRVHRVYVIWATLTVKFSWLHTPKPEGKELFNNSS